MRLPNDRPSTPALSAGDPIAPWISAQHVVVNDDLAGLLWSDYTPDADGLLATRSFRIGTGNAVATTAVHSFGFHAWELRQAQGFTYARLAVTFELIDLSWAQLCIDRPDERGKLARAAWQALPTVAREVIPLADLSHYLDQFCAGLWRAWRALNATSTAPHFAGGIEV